MRSRTPGTRAALLSALLVPTLAAATGLGVRAATVTAAPSEAGDCRHRFIFTGTITASTPDSVVYVWERSDGGHTPRETLVFRRPGARVVRADWVFRVEPGGRAAAWERLRILAPSAAASDSAVVRLSCPTRGR